MHIRTLTVAGVACVALAANAWALAPAQRLGATFDAPVFLTAPLGDARLFVVERAGRIKVSDGSSTSTYLDISSQVDSSGERGLLGLAFDPGFASNGRFYVNYIDNATKNTVVASYTATSAAASVADPGSARTVLSVAQPPALGNHKAGWIGFRPGEAANLYIATGDGGGGNDPDQRAQNLNDNLGKMLRVTPLAGGGYTVPIGNPYAGATAGNDEIWAYGLRNPYRNSFDRTTGDLWIADVGQGTREEIDFEAAGTPGGRNYGWRALEGSGDNPDVPDAAPPATTLPLYDYGHPAGAARSIIGGYVYRGSFEQGLDGSYFFGDFITGQLFSLRRSGGVVTGVVDRTSELGTPFGGSTLSSFGEDGLGNLYALGLNGEIYRIAVAQAVPEPASWLLFVLGAATFMWRVRCLVPVHGSA